MSACPAVRPVGCPTGTPAVRPARSPHVPGCVQNQSQNQTVLRAVCGVSGYDQIQSDGDLGTFAARLGLEIER